MDHLKYFGITIGGGNYQQEAFYGLILIYNVLFNRIGQYLQEWGLTPAQFNILMVVAKQAKETGISQADLSKKLIVTPSNITRLLEKMEKEKLVVRAPQQQDKRVKLVFVTPKGSALLEKVWPVYENKIQEAAAVLTPQEQKITATVLSKWLNQLVS